MYMYNGNKGGGFEYVLCTVYSNPAYTSIIGDKNFII